MDTTAKTEPGGPFPRQVGERAGRLTGLLTSVVAVVTRFAHETRRIARTVQQEIAIRMTQLRLDVASERGDVAEKVVIVGVFVALAIAAGAIIYDKVIAASNAINLN